MNPNRIEQIQLKVMESTSLSPDDKAALLKDLDELKAEAASLPKRDAGDAPADHPKAEAVVEELKASVQGLEASHPRVTELVNRVAVVLSNMGI